MLNCGNRACFCFVSLGNPNLSGKRNSLFSGKKKAAGPLATRKLFETLRRDSWASVNFHFLKWASPSATVAKPDSLIDSKTFLVAILACRVIWFGCFCVALHRCCQTRLCSCSELSFDFLWTEDSARVHGCNKGCCLENMNFF